MKFYVCVDCEGVACTVGESGKFLNESRNAPFALLEATREADAAAKGLFDAGATQVVVWDCHAASLNLHYDLLDERCDIALGSGFPGRFPGMDASFAGVLFVGYHSMDNTVDGVLCHTMSSLAYQWVKANGREVGEMAIDGAAAGERGVPVIFAASDDKGVAEALKFFPGVETVVTKTGYGRHAAIGAHPKRIQQAIREGAKRAAGKAKTFAPFRIPGPIVLEKRMKRIEAAESLSRARSGWERGEDPFVVRRTIRTMEEYV